MQIYYVMQYSIYIQLYDQIEDLRGWRAVGQELSIAGRISDFMRYKCRCPDSSLAHKNMIIFGSSQGRKARISWTLIHTSVRSA